MRCAMSSASTYLGKFASSIGATMVLRLGSVTTSSSAARRISASRTGERDMSKRSARLVSSSSCPGCSVNARISVRSAS